MQKWMLKDTDYDSGQYIYNLKNKLESQVRLVKSSKYYNIYWQKLLYTCSSVGSVILWF